ncbi:MAG: response regulator [Dehalococcoidia bacterium]
MSEQTRVLVVDDNPDLLYTLSQILKRSGFIVDVAADGRAAVDKFKAHSFDVVLMDIIMPRMSGVEALRRIKQANPAARVILMTAYYDQALVQKAREEGALSVTAKPINIARVLEMVKAATLTAPVLIVDDDPSFSRTMAQALELEGYLVYTASSGEEAVSIAGETACSVAFVDIRLPNMNGLETCLELKRISPDLMVVMMTGYGDEVHDIVEKGLKASAVNCLYKPFDPSQVVDLVGQFGR